jgi:hypothetical protein
MVCTGSRYGKDEECVKKTSAIKSVGRNYIGDWSKK